MLLTLPSDVLHEILDQITTTRDLKHLCEVSSHLRHFVTPILYQSIILKAKNENELDQIGPLPSASRDLLRHVKNIQITSSFRLNKFERCPHEKYDWNYWNENQNELKRSSDEDLAFYLHLTERLMPILEGCKDDSLKGFTWGLGTCIPKGLLEPSGYLPLRQTKIESIRLITDGACGFHARCLSPVDLSAFKHLKKLSWVGLRSIAHFNTVNEALRHIATQLQELELDLVDWGIMAEEILPCDESGETIDCASCMILPLPAGSTEQIFPVLRKLILSSFWLDLVGEELAHALNFSLLRSLKLHLSNGWEIFFEHIIQTNQQINLTSLELHHSTSASRKENARSIAEFLEAFVGLEELYLSLVSPFPILDLWRSVVHHCETLQRFVFHLRDPDGTNVNPDRGDYCDTPALSLEPEDIYELRDTTKNPLNGLQLRYLGLSCVPELLPDILSPYTRQNTLQVLHIRQSGPDVKYNTAWIAALKLPSETSGHKAQLKLTNEVAILAAWAFGPAGIPSLKIIALGDFSYNVRYNHSFIIRRRTEDEISEGGGGNRKYNFYTQKDSAFWDLVDEYGDFLEVCPVDPILSDY